MCFLLREKMKLFKRHIFVSLFVCCLVTACSSTQRAYQQNFRMYLESDIDIKLTSEEVVQSPMDLIYVKNGERPIATMALGFIENGKYKWLSKDDVMIVTDNGRVIKTLGLDKNVTFVDHLKNDPISKGQSLNIKNWITSIDTDYGDSGAKIESTFDTIKNVTIVIQGAEFNTTKVEEKIKYNSSLNGEKSWVNTYWYHIDTGYLIQSHQTPSAYSDRLEITYISRVMRLLEE